MTDTIVQQVQTWFASRGRVLSQRFSKINLLLSSPTDLVKGQATIQVDGEKAGASITFWNKGDVEAMVLDKTSGKNHVLDDRVLAANDDVSVLLQGYSDRLLALVKDNGR